MPYQLNVSRLGDVIGESQACEIAKTTLPSQEWSLGTSRELAQGRFFPYACHGLKCGGVIVNKQTGKVLRVGTANFPIERDLSMYDNGYQFERYDLVILKVVDLEKTVQALWRIRPSVVEPSYEYGQVWRVPRALTRNEIRRLIANLPCIFGNIALYSDLELLEETREAGWFTFEALECRHSSG